MTASDDRTARLWDARTGKLAAVLGGHGAKVNAAVFTSDGQHLVTGSDDGTARVWDTRPNTAIPLFDPSALAQPGQITFASVASIEDPRAPASGQALLNSGNPRREPERIASGADPCAGLDSDPEDPRDATPNATDDLPPTDDAVGACRTAATRDNDPRHLYQLARGLEKSKALVEAVAQYQAAGKLGYGPADFRLALIDWTRNGAGDRQQAVALLQQGAEAGDADSHRRLAELYERGEGVEADPRQALLHHIISAKLFVGASDAEIAHYRAASIARNLPPQDVVTAATGAATWLSGHAAASQH